MDIKKYKVSFSRTALLEIRQIYSHISDKILNSRSSKNTMKKLENKIELLKYAPKIYSQIEKNDSLGRRYRKMVLEKYIILYTIVENKREVYISHVLYSKSDYLNKI